MRVEFLLGEYLECPLLDRFPGSISAFLGQPRAGGRAAQSPALARILLFSGLATIGQEQSSVCGL